MISYEPEVDRERYNELVLPLGMAGVTVLSCKECGALVTDQQWHTDWHETNIRLHRASARLAHTHPGGDRG